MKDRIRQVLLFGLPTNIDFALLQKQKDRQTRAALCVSAQ